MKPTKDSDFEDPVFAKALVEGYKMLNDDDPETLDEYSRHKHRLKERDNAAR